MTLNRLIVWFIAKGQPKKEPEIAIVTQDLLRSIRDETAKKPGRQAAILDQKVRNYPFTKSRRTSRKGSRTTES